MKRRTSDPVDVLVVVTVGLFTPKSSNRSKPSRSNRGLSALVVIVRHEGLYRRDHSVLISVVKVAKTVAQQHINLMHVVNVGQVRWGHRLEKYFVNRLSLLGEENAET